MFSSLAAFVKFSFLLAVASVFLIAATSYTVTVFKRAFCTAVVQVGKFPDLANNANDRAPYLLARANELTQPVPLDGLYEVKVPPLTTQFGEKEDFKFLDDVKINIQGVDLPNVIKGLFAALPEDQPILTGTPETVDGGGSAVRLEWTEPSGKKKKWLLRSDKPPTDPAATEQIVDQAIYAIAYYMHYDPTGPGPRSTSAPPFPSEQALQAYYSGQQHLSVYQHKRNAADIQKAQGDLNEAEKQFRILYQEMPNYAAGLMLLGITLLEQKHETEAIIIFDRVKQNILRGKSIDDALKNLTVEDKKTLFSAMLFWATAQRKLYRIKSNHLALAELEQVEREIAPLHPTPTDAAPSITASAEQMDFLKIHISVLAEKAYVLGSYLVLLNDANFVEGLRKNKDTTGVPAADNPPVSVALKDDALPALEALEKEIKKRTVAVQQAKDAAAKAKAEQAKADPTKAEQAETATQQAIATVEQAMTAVTDKKEERLPKYRGAMGTIYAGHEDAVKAARTLINSVTSSDDAWKSARARFLSDISNASGYAQYRHAQATMDVVSLDDDFQAACKSALSSLQEAYAAHQGEQTILLNLGLITGDPRCDPSGEHIEQARTYLSQASALKPNDYYPLQLLATLGIRDVYTWGPFVKDDTLANAVQSAEKARELRPEAGTILALLAQGYILQWAQAANDTDRSALQNKIEAAIAQAEKRKATPAHLHTVRLQWLVKQAAKASSDNDKKKFAGDLKDEISDAIADAQSDHSWYGTRLLSDAQALQRMMAKTEGQPLQGIHWPN